MTTTTGAVIAATLVVVLAIVVGAFVLDSGGSPGPDATVEFDQSKSTYASNWKDTDVCSWVEAKDLTIRHTEGEAFDNGDVTVRVSVADPSTTGLAMRINDGVLASSASETGRDIMVPCDNSAGTEDDPSALWTSRTAREITSGDETLVNSYIVPSEFDKYERGANASDARAIARGQVDAPCEYYWEKAGGQYRKPENAQPVEEFMSDGGTLLGIWVTSNYSSWSEGDECSSVNFDRIGAGEDQSTTHMQRQGFLTQGDEVRVLWNPTNDSESVYLANHTVS